MPTAPDGGKPPIVTNARRRIPPEVLTKAEVRALLNACGDGSPTHARIRALIAVVYRGGLRVSEALAAPLYPKDLDPTTGAVRVLWGKGGRARTIGLDPGAFRLVGAWMRRRVYANLAGPVRHAHWKVMGNNAPHGPHVPQAWHAAIHPAPAV